jgi:hypothetical protein
LRASGGDRFGAKTGNGLDFDLPTELCELPPKNRRELANRVIGAVLTLGVHPKALSLFAAAV